MNETLTTFGYPMSALREYEHWAVLLRPAQVTLGSMVVCTTQRQTRMADMPPAAFAELAMVFRGAEGALRGAFAADRINHLMLMMVDPHVHWHLIPRYETSRTVGSTTIADEGWPGFPALTSGVRLPNDDRAQLRAQLLAAWPDGT
jgi:diadenosine tetraphosphate (Ap4A) HIT family hydrolase